MPKISACIVSLSPVYAHVLNISANLIKWLVEPSRHDAHTNNVDMILQSVWDLIEKQTKSGINSACFQEAKLAR